MDEFSISKALFANDVDPNHLIEMLKDSLREERELYDLKKCLLSELESLQYQIRLTQMEKLLITLQIEKYTK